MKDVTERYRDLNPGDRVYRTDRGWFVKARVVDQTASPSILSFRVSASWVDEMTGKARPFQGGHFIVDPHELTIRPDSEVDLDAELETARRAVIARADLAIANHYAREKLAGRPV